MKFLEVSRPFFSSFILLIALISLQACGGGNSSDVTARSFITTWKTDNPGFSADNQIKIGTSGGGYNYSVDWGDGQTDRGVNGDITHTYTVPGIYTVKISGAFPRIIFDPADYDYSKLLSIEQWGTIKWQSMRQAFAVCINLVSNAVDTPDLSQVTDMSSMFASAAVFNQDISGWNVSSVTNMSSMFANADSFNQDISAWDVSSVTDMSFMFFEADAFNQNISAWNVSSVTNMSQMFSFARIFNKNINDWDMSSVTDVSGMFFDASAFNQDISGWNLSSVSDMSLMFAGASAFNQNISAWNVSYVADMGNMFSEAIVFNQDISGWDVSSVTEMRYMFSGAVAFNQDISGWNVSSVNAMSNMFNGASAFNQDLSTWNVSSVTIMHSMFTNSALSTANYDALLLGWSAQSLQKYVFFGADNIQYSSTSQAARDVLTGGFNWIVTDGGVTP